MSAARPTALARLIAALRHPSRWPTLTKRLMRDMRAEARSVLLWPLALVVGVIGGYAALALQLTLQAFQLFFFAEGEERLAEAAAILPPAQVILAPVLGGVLVGALLWLGKRLDWLPETRARGIADVMEARAVHNGEMPVRPALLSALISASSLGSGVSAGREGPAVHLGASLASGVSRLLGLPPRGARILLACGAASAVAASFDAPIAGALFAFEVILGHYALRSIAPVAAASVTGALVARLHLGAAPAFPMPAIAPASLLDFALVAPLALICAALAVAFVQAGIHLPRLTALWAERSKIPLWALPPAGGLLVGCLGVMAPEVLGVGYDVTGEALAGAYDARLLIGFILLKLVATVLTLSARFGGGVFSPSLYLGAMTGALFAATASALFGDAVSGTAFYAVVGMGALSGAVLGAPLSTTLIVFELTASYEASIALLVAVSLSTVTATAFTKGSFFHKQVERHGYDLTKGDARVILQTIRARDVMSPVDRDDRGAEMDAPSLYEDDYLARVIGFLSAEKLDGAPVRRRTGDQEIVGYVTKADAHAAYASALQHRHEEEHR